MKVILILLFSLIPFALTWAHGGEDHAVAPQPAPTVPSKWGAESTSSEFEIVAEMAGETLIVYLNRYADNQPVSKAVVEVESGAFKTQLHAVAAGVYQAPAASLAKVGVHPLVLTLGVGKQSDLLETSLTVTAPIAAKVPALEIQSSLLIGGGGLALLLLIVALRRRGGNK